MLHIYHIFKAYFHFNLQNSISVQRSKQNLLEYALRFTNLEYLFVPFSTPNYIYVYRRTYFLSPSERLNFSYSIFFSLFTRIAHVNTTVQVEQSEFCCYIVSVVVTDTRLMSVFHLFCYLPHLCVRIYVPARCDAMPAVTIPHTLFFRFSFQHSSQWPEFILHSPLNTKAFLSAYCMTLFSSFFCSAALPLLSFPASSSSSSGGITTAIYYTSTHPLLTY